MSHCNLCRDCSMSANLLKLQTVSIKVKMFFILNTFDTSRNILGASLFCRTFQFSENLLVFVFFCRISKFFLSDFEVFFVGFFSLFCRTLKFFLSDFEIFFVGL